MYCVRCAKQLMLYASCYMFLLHTMCCMLYDTSTLYTTYGATYAIYKTSNGMYYAMCDMHDVRCAMYCVPCALYYALCTVYCSLCAMSSVLFTKW